MFSGGKWSKLFPGKISKSTKSFGRDVAIELFRKPAGVVSKSQRRTSGVTTTWVPYRPSLHLNESLVKRTRKLRAFLHLHMPSLMIDRLNMIDGETTSLLKIFDKRHHTGPKVKQLSSKCPALGHLVGMWWACGGHVVGMWWAFGGHLVGTCFTFGPNSSC